MNNYDRIKSMSVEEMAEFNVTHDAENNMYLSLNGFLYGTKEVAIQKKIQWLLQEVSDDERDIEEAEHAHWIEEGGKVPECSNCKKIFERKGDYCIHCGAKMDVSKMEITTKGEK